MSNRYKGGIISATPPTTTGGESGTASGAWTLEQQMQAQAAGLWPIQPPPLYIEDVFSTWLYTGNGATQTITNGINLSGKGGLVWTKNRANAYDHYLYDTARGVNKVLLSNNTIDQQSLANTLTAFNSNGFTLGGSDYGNILPGAAAVSWTFRKQEKFFDCVTYTGDGVAGRTVAHNLGSVPGCIIVKRTNTTGPWEVYHRSLGNNRSIRLNTTDGQIGTTNWNNTTPTATEFTVGAFSETNGNGSTYVAYLFAHDAGGFGPTESENVISCGSYTGDGTVGRVVDFGYEPQWVLFKRTDTSDDWYLFDTMRELTTDISARLRPNTSDEENRAFYYIPPNATGITFNASGGGALNASGGTYIYIAIRRGPMKVPTDGTSVFSPVTRAGTSATATITSGFVADTVWATNRAGTTRKGYFDRLRGALLFLDSAETDGEISAAGSLTGFDNNTGVTVGNESGGWEVINGSGKNYVNWMFRRAPGFFDVVCYTGNSVAGRTVAHNLAATPELLIVKRRAGGAANWNVGAAAGPGWGNVYILNSTGGASLTGEFTPAPTSSVFSVSDSGGVNASGSTYVAYLFASAPGVSKVGSYTGTGTTQQINCGFTAGARFVLIKRTDSTGGWYVWDSARGIVAGDDPYLLLNSTAAEVTNTDYVDTYSAGFEISSTAPAAINASGGTFIFLAIA